MYHDPMDLPGWPLPLYFVPERFTTSWPLGVGRQVSIHAFDPRLPRVTDDFTGEQYSVTRRHGTRIGTTQFCLGEQ